MNLVIFAHKDAVKQTDELTRAVSSGCPKIRITLCHTVNSLIEKLKQYTGDTENQALILMADSARRLEKFAGIRDLLEGRRLLFILPDQSLSTLRFAQTFSPRFFTFLNTRYDDLCAVLNKMSFKEAS